MTTKRRIIQGIGANGFGQVTTLLIQLASIPILIHAWGIELYGEWITLSAIPAYLALADIGLTTIAANKLSIIAESGDKKRMLSIYQSTWLMVSTLSLAVLLLILSLVWLTDLASLLGLQLVTGNELALTLFFLFLHVAISMQTGILQIPYRIVKKNPFAVAFVNFIRLFEWLIATALVIVGGDVLVVAITFFTVRLLGNIFLFLLSKKLNSPLHFGFHYAKKHVLHDLLKPSIASMCFPLGLSFTMQGIILVISSTLGSTAVALFSIYRTFTRLPIQIATSVNQSVWPELSYAFGEKNFRKARKLVLKMLQFSAVLCLFSFFAIYTLGVTVIDIWISKPLEHNINLLSALTLSALVHILWQPFWVAQIATNKHVRFAISFLIFSFLSLILCWQFLPLFGLSGAGYAVFISEIFLALAAFLSYQLHFGSLKHA